MLHSIYLRLNTVKISGILSLMVSVFVVVFLFYQFNHFASNWYPVSANTHHTQAGSQKWHWLHSTNAAVVLLEVRVSNGCQIFNQKTVLSLSQVLCANCYDYTVNVINVTGYKYKNSYKKLTWKESDSTMQN